MGFPCGSDSKESASMQEPQVGSLGQENPLPVSTSVFLPGELHGQRSLAGFSSGGHKLLDGQQNLGEQDK